MCEYCTCRVQPSIARFGAEHEQIQSLVVDLRQAHAAGDRDAVVALAERVQRALVPHVAREERGLFPELSAAGASGHVRELEGDHARLDAALATVAGGELDGPGWAALPGVLDELDDHIWREEYDVFPAAIQLLGPSAWQRVEDTCASLPGARGAELYLTTG